MRRLTALLLSLVLFLPAAAGASGLGGLRDAVLSQSGGSIPDPASLLGQEGELIRENYEFIEGYYFSAYLYPQPTNETTEDFLDHYEQLVEARGLEKQMTQIEGYDGLAVFVDDDHCAILIPDFDGKILLLVSNGTDFNGASKSASASPTAAPEPEEAGYYLRVKRNGRQLEYAWNSHQTSCKEVTRSIGTSKSFEISCIFQRAEITLFTLCFPNYAQTGDEFYVTPNSLIDGLYFYTAEEGSLVFYDASYEHKMKGGKDFFRVSITRMEHTEDGLVIEGAFEGSFQNGTILYEEGSFRVLGYD